MKYTLSFILVFCFIFTLFTGCGKVSETPTDINSPATQQTAGQEETLIDSRPAEQELENENQQEAESQKEDSVPSISSQGDSQLVSSKIPTNSVTSKESSANTPVQKTDAPVADIIVEYPTFTGETSLKNWLLGKHPDYFADGRNDMLTTMGTQENAVYYKPSVPANHSLFTLSQVEVHTPSGGMNYFYNGTGEESELVVCINTRDATAQGFGKSEANLYATIKSYCLGTLALPEGMIAKQVTYNGLDFYYRYSSNQDYTTVAWKQYDLYQIASLHGHFDQIDEIIPLLYLQQVKVTDNTVTQ